MRQFELRIDTLLDELPGMLCAEGLATGLHWLAELLDVLMVGVGGDGCSG